MMMTKIRGIFHMRGRKYLLALGLTALLTFEMERSAVAQAVSSTVSEDNGATSNANNDAGSTADGDQDVYSGTDTGTGSTVNHPAVIATGGGVTGTGYDFTGQTLPTTVTGLQITLTVTNGNSASAAQEGLPQGQPDDFDYNFLVLYVGGTYDTTTGLLTGTPVEVPVSATSSQPLLLNGFRGSDLVDTQVFTASFTSAVGASILSQFSGGHLTAFIGTTNPNDTSPVSQTGDGPNELFVSNDSNGDGTGDATTTLILVPEPGTMGLLLAAGCLLLPISRLRSGRKAAAV